MEKLDFYDEYMNFLGTKTRDEVHELGLWHKTVHCWLYDNEGNVYFQIRKDSNKLYTTASGHVLAGETVKQAFAREVKEEIGINVNSDNAQMVEINVWKNDKEKNDIIMKDRAFANVYINKFEGNINLFRFDKNEVAGIVKINATDCLNLLINEKGTVNAYKIFNDGINKEIPVEIGFEDFLIFKNEIGLIKYGKILQAIIKSI